MTRRSAVWLVVGLCLAAPVALAQAGVAPGSRELPPGLQVPAAARPGPAFDVERATDSYLALLSPEQRARSDAYFEGGYWLQLWQLLYGLGVAALLLLTGLSRRMRAWAQRVSRRPWAVTLLYVLQWLLVMFLLDLPMGVYAGFLREHQYGLSTQTFGAWLADGLKGLGVSLVLAPPLLALVYAAVRRAGERWWVWATGIAAAAIVFAGAIAPVFIAPLFNKYEPLPPGPVRDSVLSLARASRIPAHDVYVFDASRQTTRVSANVSGMLGTTRISLNDNLLERTSPEEIRAVMGHEMGHYVLNHSTRLIVYLSLVIALALFGLHRASGWLLGRYGARLGIEGRADPAGLPLAVALLALFMTLLGPVTRSIVRQAEAEADAFGLAAAREPHGFATVAMRLSTYRKIHPGPLEEVLFFDHPSGYDRVQRSMVWLKENQDDPRVRAVLESVADGEAR